MSDERNVRKERIERLLRDLRYEVERGMMERDIEEEMGFRFVVPVSNTIKDGIVVCEFRTRPMLRGAISPDDLQPRLHVVRN